MGLFVFHIRVTCVLSFVLEIKLEEILAFVGCVINISKTKAIINNNKNVVQQVINQCYIINKVARKIYNIKFTSTINPYPANVEDMASS